MVWLPTVMNPLHKQESMDCIYFKFAIQGRSDSCVFT